MRGFGGGRHDGAAGGGGSASGRWAEGREGGAGEAKGRGRSAPGVTEGVAQDRGRVSALHRGDPLCGRRCRAPGPPRRAVLRAPNPECGAPDSGGSPHRGLGPPTQRPLQVEARQAQARGGVRGRGLPASLATKLLRHRRSPGRFEREGMGPGRTPICAEAARTASLAPRGWEGDPRRTLASG